MNTLIIGIGNESDDIFSIIRKYSKNGKLPYLIFSNDYINIRNNMDMNALYLYRLKAHLDGTEEMRYEEQYKVLNMLDEQINMIVGQFDNLIIATDPGVDGLRTAVVSYFADKYKDKHLYFVCFKVPFFMGAERRKMSDYIVQITKDYTCVYIDGQSICSQDMSMLDCIKKANAAIADNIYKLEVQYNLTNTINFMDHRCSECDIYLKSLIDNHLLTKGKVYHATSTVFGNYLITANDGDIMQFPPYIFESVFIK